MLIFDAWNTFVVLICLQQCYTSTLQYGTQLSPDTDLLRIQLQVHVIESYLFPVFCFILQKITNLYSLLISQFTVLIICLFFLCTRCITSCLGNHFAYTSNNCVETSDNDVHSDYQTALPHFVTV